MLIYKKPFDNPPTAPVAELALAAPLPSYPTRFVSVSPNRPFCVLRNASQPYQNTLTLSLSDLPDTGALEVQLRKLTDRWMRTLRANDDRVRIDHRNKRVHVSGVWSGLWNEYESTWATVRLLSHGDPVTDWSSSFIVADDAAACGNVNHF